MIEKEALYGKYRDGEPLSVEECQWLVYYESVASRGDSDHEPGDDPLVGALVRDEHGRVIALAHRANGMEGDHAEYSILKGQLAGEDLSRCSFFTTLEPCVDDVRGKPGSSCSSLLCASAVKTIYIGILDPNPSVYSVGIAKLFEAGKTLVPFLPEVRDAVRKLFEKKPEAAPSAVRRLKREVFPKFQEGSLRRFLEDKHLFETGSSEGFDFEASSNVFASYLLDKGWVSFSAKQAFVENGVQIMFYDSRYIGTSNRVAMVRDSDSFSERLDDSFPILMEKAARVWSGIPDRIPYAIFKEAFVNAFIHGDFSPDSPLIYVSRTPISVVIENSAAPAISQSQLDRLPKFAASPEPGNGCLSELARLCGYCERDKRGEKTFSEHRDRVSCSVDGRHVKLEVKIL